MIGGIFEEEVLHVASFSKLVLKKRQFYLCHHPKKRFLFILIATRERERERDCVCTSIVLSNFQLSTIKHNDILATKFTHSSGNNVTNHLPTTQ
jgi:hypothetical protein